MRQARLKARKLFQFHKVRLKETEKKLFTIFAMFQFHKVRLKENWLNELKKEATSFNSIRYD